MSSRRARTNRAAEAHIEVVCPGMLEVLSVGKGDIKLSVGSDDPVEKERAQRIIAEMLRKGYGIFVETDEGLARVRRFDPEKMTYVISDVPVEPEDEEPDAEAADAEPKPKRGRPRKQRERHVPVAETKATVIGRTAGG